MKCGYAWISPGGKSESVDAQARQPTKAGWTQDFRSAHVCGANADRAQPRSLLDPFDAGDLLIVTRLDRLARSARDLLNTLGTIIAKKAGFRSPCDAWADTTTSAGLC
jgi:DNA invertase Pin-like site-specific DNA recombinase